MRILVFGLQLMFLALALVAPLPSLAADVPAPLEPDATSAVLNGDARHVGWGDTMGLAIVSLDGKDLGKGLFGVRYPASVRLTPGRHTFRLTYRAPMSAASGDFWLDAEAGKAYSMRMNSQNYGSVRLWLEETATGLIVGGIDNGDGGPPLVASAAAAAAPTDAEAREELPVADAKMALLVCDPGKPGRNSWNDIHPQSHLQILRLDGVRQFHMGSRDQVVKLTPGHHKVTLLHEAGRGGFIPSDQEIDVAAGKVYVVHEQLNGYTADFWIERADTGEVVSGFRPLPGPTTPAPAPETKQ